MAWHGHVSKQTAQPVQPRAPTPESPKPLLWIAILYWRVALAASTGVESSDDLFNYLLAGADTVMTTSSLLRHGVGHMRTLVDGLATLLAAREMETLDDIRGRMSQKNVKNPTAFECANYIQLLQGYHILPAIRAA